MFVKYGTYAHPSDEAGVQFSIRSILDANGLPFQSRRTAVVSGTLLAETEIGMSNKVQALINAYSENGHDLGLYHTDGTVTPIFLSNSSSVNGVQVVDHNFPTPDSVYATNYDFRITLQADYMVGEGTSTDVLEYSETLTYIGNGGPRVVGIELELGLPAMQRTRQRTLCQAIQSGRSVGFLTHVIPNPYWPTLLQNPDSSVSLDTALRGGAHSYAASWNYIFLSPVPFPRRAPDPR